ncbi:hypothetical protein CcCBS67573_g07548, partial [Chytriomyces confervae]
MGPNTSKAKKPAPATTSSRMPGPATRKANQPPLKTSSVQLSKAAPLHVPNIVDKTANAPGVQLPIVPHDVPHNVADEKPASAPVAPVAPANAVAPPRIELKFLDGTLGTEIQSQILDDLARAFEDMIVQLDKKSGSQVDVGGLIRQIDDVAVRASAFAENAKSLLSKVSIISSDAGEAVDKFIATIDSVTSTHPLLKLSWFVVYAGYKMVKDASELDDKYRQLPGRFQAVLESVHAFLEIRILGIENEKTRRPLVKASEDIILCLTDGAILFTEYMDEPGTTWSNLSGSNKKKLNQMNERLASVQKAHKTAQEDGLVPILTNGIADIKESMGGLQTGVDGLNTRLDGLQETIVKNQAARETIVKDQAARDKKESVQELLDLCNPLLESIRNGGKPVTWLRCEAGTGKSVIAALVAQKLEEQNMLGAVFFCKAVTRESLVVLIQTIAFELAMINDAFRNKLVETLKNCNFQDASNAATPKIQDTLRIFIVEPMKAWPENASAVIVIDALDEIKDTTNNINRLIGTFLHLSTVKLFVTSRPEVKVGSMEISTANAPTQIEFIAFDQMAPQNLEDLQTFAHMRLDVLFAKYKKEFGPRIKENLTEMLVEKSSGLFIWMTLVLGSLDQGELKTASAHARNNRKKIPETMVELIKSLEASALLGLQDLYCDALSNAFLDGEEAEKDQQCTLFKASVGTLMMIKAPVSADTVPYLFPENEIFEDILASLDSISALTRTDAEGKLLFIHKTVPDFIKSIDLPHVKGAHTCEKDVNFKLDLDEISFNIAIACLDVLNSDLSYNMAELDGSVDYSDAKNPQWNVNVALPEYLQYAILHWSDHFTAAFKNVNLYHQQQLLSKLQLFCEGKLLNYLEATLLVDKLGSVPTTVNSVVLCLKGSHSPNFVSVTQTLLESETSLQDHTSSENSAAAITFITSILQDLKHVSIDFSAQLALSPLQVYNNALTLVPQQTAYYRQYQKDLQVRLIMGAEQDWGPLRLSGHSGTVNSVAVTRDGKTIVSGSYDNTVKVWDTESGECTSTLEGHSFIVNSVAVTPDGKTIVSGSWDNTVKVWDTESGECTSTLTGHTKEVTSVTITPDCEVIVSGSKDRTVKVWDTQTGKCIGTLPSHAQ